MAKIKTETKNGKVYTYRNGKLFSIQPIKQTATKTTQAGYGTTNRETASFVNSSVGVGSNRNRTGSVQHTNTQNAQKSKNTMRESKTGKVYKAGVGYQDRAAQSKTYNYGLSNIAKARKAEETAQNIGRDSYAQNHQGQTYVAGSGNQERKLDSKKYYMGNSETARAANEYERANDELKIYDQEHSWVNTVNQQQDALRRGDYAALSAATQQWKQNNSERNTLAKKVSDAQEKVFSAQRKEIYDTTNAKANTAASSDPNYSATVQRGLQNERIQGSGNGLTITGMRETASPDRRDVVAEGLQGDWLEASELLTNRLNSVGDVDAYKQTEEYQRLYADAEAKRKKYIRYMDDTSWYGYAKKFGMLDKLGYAAATLNEKDFDAYFKNLQLDLTAKGAEQQKKELKDITGGDNPNALQRWTAAIMNVALQTSPTAGADYGDTLGKSIYNATHDVEDRLPTNPYGNTGQARLQNLTQEQASVGLNDVQKFFMNAGLSSASMVLGAATGGGAYIYNQGLGAGSQAAQDALEKGGDYGQAAATGTAAAAAATLMEKVGIDNIFGAVGELGINGSTAKNIAKAFLKSAASEGMEEAGEEVVNIVADMLVMGDKSDVQQYLNAYINNNQNSTKAQQDAALAMYAFSRIGQNALAGAITGGAFGGATMLGAYGDYGTAATAEDVKSLYRESAKENGIDLTGKSEKGIAVGAAQELITQAYSKEAKKAAATAQKQIEIKHEVSDAALTNLFNTVMSDKNRTAAQNAADADAHINAGRDFYLNNPQKVRIQSTPVLNKYAGRETVDSVLGRTYATNMPVLESLAGKDAVLRAGGEEIDKAHPNNLKVDTIWNKDYKANADRIAAKNGLSLSENNTENPKYDIIREQGGSTYGADILHEINNGGHSTRAGEQAQRMVESAESLEERRSFCDRIRGTDTVKRRAYETAEEKITLDVIEDTSLPEALQKITDENKSMYGKSTYFFIDDAEVEIDGEMHSADGFRDENGDIWLSANAEDIYTINDHERFHILYSENVSAADVFSKTMLGTLTPEEFDVLMDQYKVNYSFLDTDNAVYEEILADIYAGRIALKNSAAVAEAISKLNTDTLAYMDAVNRGDMTAVVDERKYSARDTAYLDAVNRGDMETAQRMVDEAAKEANYTVKGSHGTVNFFNIFERKYGNSEGDWGKGFYFTNNEEDVKTNYANTEGADLTAKIELLAERLEWMDGYEDMDYDERIEEAKKRLIKGEPRVIEAYLRMENPVVIGGQNETYFDMEQEYDEEYDEYGELEGRLVDFVNALEFVLEDYEGADVPLYEFYEDGYGYTASQLESKARELLAYVEDEDGNIATGEIIRAAFEQMGFDGIVDNTVSAKFGAQSGKKNAMAGVNADTTHYIVFNSSQAKQRDPVTYDDNGNVIPLSERFNRQKKDIRYSLRDASRDLSDTESKQTPRQTLDEMARQYGTIKPGETPVRESNLPKKTSKDRFLSQFARTLYESGSTTEEMLPALESKLAAGDFSYEKIKNSKLASIAQKTVAEGMDSAQKIWDGVVENGATPKAGDIALGQTLYNEYVKNGDYDSAIKIASELAVEATRLGQSVQAFRLLKKLTPDGQLYVLERTKNNIKKELIKKMGDKAPDITIDETLAENLLRAKTPQEIESAVDAIKQDIADQMPATFADKLNAWRYLAMLGNPRTHIRNIAGNTIFIPMRAFKNLIGAGLEKAGKLEQSKRTKTVLNPIKDKAYIEAGKKSFETVKDILQGTDKYGDRDIYNRRQIFKNRFLETARKLNSKALELEDVIFMKSAYVNSYAQAMKARGLTSETMTTKQESEISEHAIQEALKATYRDFNGLASALNRIKNSNKATKIIGEGLMPFTTTPLNILKRGVEYSPVGVAKGVYEVLHDVKNGVKTPAEAIDTISSGLSGTAIMAVGVVLSALGLITSGGGDDEGEDALNKLTGGQNYAIEIGGHSYTIDWAAPTVLPLFIGVELERTLFEGNPGGSIKNILDSITKISDPLFNLSMLSSINSAIETAKYSEGVPLTDIAINIATSYAGQFIPTVFGQFARIIDDTVRKTYYAKDSALPKAVDSFVQGAMKKIPGLNFLLQPSVDRWGREIKSGSIGERLSENLVSPGYYSKRNFTNVDVEIDRLYKQIGESAVIPPIPEKYFTVDGERKDLSASEYKQYSKLLGQGCYRAAEQTVNNPEYAKLSDREKSAAIQEAYNYAKQTAKSSISGYTVDNWVSELNKSGVNKGLYFSIKAKTSGIESNKDAQGNTIENSKPLKIKDVIDNTTSNEANKKKLYDLFGVNKKVASGYVTWDDANKPKLSNDNKTQIKQAAGYDIPEYKTETLEKIQNIGVSVEDYAYIDDRIAAYGDKVGYIKGFGFNDKQTSGLVQSLVMGKNAKDKMRVANEEYGISNDDYIRTYMAGYSSVGSKSERNAQIRSFVDSLPGLTDDQKDILYEYNAVSRGKYDSEKEKSGSSGRKRSSGKRSSSRKKTVPNLSVPGVKNVSISKTRSDLVRSAMQNYMKQKQQSDLTAAYKAQLDEIDKNPFMTQKIRAAQKAKIKERFGIN